MKTDKKNSHEDSKTLRKRDNYFKTLCLRALVANRGFTLPELLTVVAIIALLIGILMPALYQVKKMAKDTKQKAQLVSIEMGINLYKNDFGDYPPSHGWKTAGDNIDYDYCGAQTLTEAMFGQDLLGFHPDSVYREDGLDKNSSNDLYPDPFNPNSNPVHKKNLDSRKGPYLQRENIGVFRVGPIPPDEGVFKPFNFNGLAKDRYVICDVFTQVNRTIGGKSYKVGTPILYFRADTSRTDINPATNNVKDRIYNFYDNQVLVEQGRITDSASHLDFLRADGTCEPFYAYIGDPFASASSLMRPVRPDSFLLISAGNDGLYGTKDDICNFDPNLPS